MLPEEGTLDEPVPPQYSTFPLIGAVTQLEAMYITFQGFIWFRAIFGTCNTKSLPSFQYKPVPCDLPLNVSCQN